MALRLTARVSVVAVLAAVPASAQAATIVPSAVGAGAVISPGATRNVALTCPANAVALNATVTRGAAGVTVLRSAPGEGAGQWRFRLTATRRQAVDVVVRCVRLELSPGLSHVRLAVQTRRRPGIAIAAGGSASAHLRCGPSWLATGYGVSARTAAVRIASAVPVRHGWNFRLENTGSRATVAGVAVRCLKKAVTANGGAARLDFRVARPVFTEAPKRGTNLFSRRCGASQFSLATGSVVDPRDDIQLVGSTPEGARGGRWGFRGARTGDRVRTSLVCLSRRGSFH
jgi:hypothetical protein